MTLQWRKSSFSADGPQCVELADAGEQMLMRDSKHPDEERLAFRHVELAALVAAVKSGAIDPLIQ